MTDQMSKIDKIRTLLTAQTHDNAWLWDTAVALGIDMTSFTSINFNDEFEKRGWGKIEIIDTEEQKAVVWHRPDGSPPSANINDINPDLKILIFALAGELKNELRKNGMASYVEVEFYTPDFNWRQCEILLNGKPAEGVISADAIFGVITIYERDKRTGKLVVENDSLKTKKVFGRVDIVVKEKQQGFF